MEDSLAYPLTLIELSAFLPLLRKEAEENRWQDVKPENFRLYRDERSSFITLEYTDDYNYLIMFRIGMEDGCFGAEIQSISSHFIPTKDNMKDYPNIHAYIRVSSYVTEYIKLMQKLYKKEFWGS